MTYNGELRFCTTEDQLKKMYFRYAKVLHPDHGGTVADFQRLQSDYEKQFRIIKGVYTNKNGGVYHANTTEKARTFIDIVNRVITLPGLYIEIVGCFVWITGNTKANRSALKAAGFKYSANKKAWYYTPVKARRKATNTTLDQVREKYGVQAAYNSGTGRKLLAY